ncbi:hypothetical protein TNCV_4325831 [Trichonephila clavipes]|nr:hypothetical protein TNCV_4325831 [Trichonephila clavipes]
MFTNSHLVVSSQAQASMKGHRVERLRYVKSVETQSPPIDVMWKFGKGVSSHHMITRLRGILQIALMLRKYDVVLFLNTVQCIKGEYSFSYLSFTPRDDRGNLVVKVTGSWLVCHEFDLCSAEDPPCRGDRFTLNLPWLTYPPVSVVWKLEGGARSDVILGT